MSESRRFECNSYSPKQTIELGRALGAALDANALVLLVGGLGSGKTQFTKGLATRLGIDAASVQSPTYTVIHEYRPPQAGPQASPQDAPVYHIDLYRLAADEIESLGLEELLEEPGLKIVEWAERLPWVLDGAININIQQLDDGRRRIAIDAPGNVIAQLKSGWN